MNGRESRFVPKKVERVVNWFEVLDAPEKHDFLLSSQGAEERREFLEFALHDLTLPQGQIARELGYRSPWWSAIPILSFLLTSPSSDTELAIKVSNLLVCRLISVDTDNAHETCKELVEDMYNLAMKFMGKHHIPALRSYIILIILICPETIEAEVDGLVEKVLLPLVEDILFDLQKGSGGDVNNDGDNDDNEEIKSIKLALVASYLESIAALLIFMSEKKLVEQIETIFSISEELAVNEHTTVKIAAAELAMSCIDLMRRRHDIEFDKTIKSFVTEVFNNNRGNVENHSLWKLLSPFLTAEARSEQSPVAVIVPFLHVDGHANVMGFSLEDQPYYDRSLRYKVTNPTTGFAEAMTLKYLHQTIGGTAIAALFVPKSLQRDDAFRKEFIRRVFEILTRAEVSGDLRRHATNLMEFPRMRKVRIGAYQYSDPDSAAARRRDLVTSIRSYTGSTVATTA